MSLLRCPGVFVVPVPDGWQVHGVPGSHYLLTPTDPGKGGEVRLAVFARPPGPLAQREGADRLLELLEELAVDPQGADIAFRARYHSDTHRALAWFPAYDAAGRDLDCLAAVVVFAHAVIACTATTSPRIPETLATAEILVAALTPDRGAGRRGESD